MGQNANICRSSLIIIKNNVNNHSTNAQKSKEKLQSKLNENDYKMFYTSKPKVIEFNQSTKLLKSAQIAVYGLLGYTMYAMAVFWDFNDTLLPMMCIGQICLSLLMRNIIKSQIQKLTLLPKYRLRFDRYSWFNFGKKSVFGNSVEFDLKDIENITVGRYGYSFNTPLSSSTSWNMFSFPLFLWINKKDQQNEVLNGLVKFYERERLMFAKKRLNQVRK